MTSDERKRKVQKLNRLGEEFRRLTPEGNEAAYLKLRNEILTTAAELFDQPNDLEAIAFICIKGEWEKYDPQKGTLYNFFSYRIGMRKKRIAQRDVGGHFEKEIDLDTGKAKKRYVPHFSLDTPVGDEEGMTQAELLPDKAPVPNAKLELDDAVLQLLLLFLNLESHLEGRSNNPIRRNYFRLFFTNGITVLLHEQETPNVLKERERDLFQAIKTEFLDYFMASVCRTVDAIAGSPAKPYGQLVNGRGEEETPLPLPNDVYVSYLDRIENYHATPAAVSQQRAAFYELRKYL